MKFSLSILSLSRVFSVIIMGSCANHSSEGAVTTTLTSSAIILDVNMPSQPNRKFSAYLCLNGQLRGAILSNTTTDSAGKLQGRFYAVDGNNCITSQYLGALGSGMHNLHYRMDSTNAASFVYPNGCPSTAGFLSDAALGSDFGISLTQGYATVSVTAMGSTGQIQFNISGTGLNGVNRQTYCSILDGGISNGTIQNSSTMGFAQGSIAYTSGNATATTTARMASSGTIVSYACWIDSNNSGTYNSGDLISSGTINSFTTAVGTWTSVP